MTRRILALLALLSGLAALSAPAHASVLDSLSSDVESLSQTVSPQSGQTCQCEQAEELRRRSCLPRNSMARRLYVLGILPPPLVIGADRALE